MATKLEDIEEVQKAILFARVNNIDRPPYSLSSPIAVAASKTIQQLRIVLISSSFNDKNADQPDSAIGTKRWDAVQRTLTYIYVQAMKVAQEMDRILMDVDVLLQGENEQISESAIADAEAIYRIRDQEPSTSSPASSRSKVKTVWLALGDTSFEQSLPPSSSPESDPGLPLLFPVVASGGTFDHLHAGHKILLSMAAWIARDKLIVGVTDDSLLVNKANKDVLQPLADRIRIARNFLELFKPGIEYYIVPITDVAGPTGWDPNVQAIVVSKETLNGATAINKIREEKGFNPLTTFVIDVISHTEESIDAHDAETLRKTKMSSTFIREWIVKQRNSKYAE